MTKAQRALQESKADALQARDRILRDFRGDHNVVGAGYGFRSMGGRPTSQPAVRVYVKQKLPPQHLSAPQCLPRRIRIGARWIDVDVVEVGVVTALSHAARERPARMKRSMKDRDAAAPGPHLGAG